MDNNQLVSIVITTYKRDVSQIKKAVESVLYQTYKNMELIIVDDSPVTYKKRNQVKAYCETINDERVTYIQHSQNFGACVARNTGLNIAKGKYISFLDDDDEYFRERLERMLPLFDERTVLVYSNAMMIYQNNLSRKEKWFDDGKHFQGYVYDKLMKGNFIGSTSFAMMKTNVLKNIGGFDVEMEASQDWDVWIRISREGYINYTEEPLVKYYVHGGSERITNDTKRRIRALRHLNVKNEDYLKTHPDIFVERKYYEMRLNILDYNLKDAIKCYLMILRIQPTKIINNIFRLKAFGRLLIRRR